MKNAIQKPNPPITNSQTSETPLPDLPHLSDGKHFKEASLKKNMKSDRYFVKSFEEDFILKRIVGKKKKSFQSIKNIIETGKIKPNTKSFGRDKRLACSFLHTNYLKTYRPQGLIFQTKKKPDLIYPFDLVLLSNAKKIVVHYYRIKNNLHMYYNHDLISGFEKFIFKDIDSMLKKFSSPSKIWREVNSFRKTSGHKELPESKHRLIEYAEVIFQRPIKIKPVAIFGYSKDSKEIAKKYNLPHFKTAKDFYESS